MNTDDRSNSGRFGFTATAGTHSSLCQKMLARANQYVDTSLQAAFDVLDDTFFDLADRCDNSHQHMQYLDAMRAIRLEKQPLLGDTKTLLASSVTELQTGRLSAEADTAESKKMPADLELVGEDNLEEIIALDTMISKARQDSNAALDELTRRLSVISRFKISNSTNPFAPETFGEVLSRASRRLNIDIRSRLVFFKLYERHLLGSINDLYAELNSLLEKDGIRPVKQDTAEANKRRVHPDEPEKHRTQPEEPGGNASALSPDVDVKPSAGAAASRGEGILLGRLGRLFSGAHSTSIAGKMDGQVDSQNKMNFDQLREVLTSLQRDSMERPAEERGWDELISAIKTRGREITGLSDLNLEDQLETVVVLVDELLNRIDGAAYVPKQLEPLVRSLKLPLLKMALDEPALFDKTHHPARRLINELARLSVQFDDREIKANDPVYQMMLGFVEPLLKDNDIRTETLNIQFAEFLERIEKHEKRIKHLEKRLLEELTAKERLNQANTRVQQLMDDELVDRVVPAIVKDFAEQAWSKVMFLDCLRSGEDSEDWTADYFRLRALVKYAEVRETNPVKIGPLLKELTERLEYASVDSFLMDELMDRLTALFADGIESSEQQILVSDLALDIPGESSADIEDDAEPVDGEALNKAENLKAGAWVEILETEDQRKRCKLAGVITPSEKYVFVNRAGAKEGELPKVRVAKSIQSDRLKELDNSHAFEKALDEVVVELRTRIRDR